MTYECKFLFQCIMAQLLSLQTSWIPTPSTLPALAFCNFISFSHRWVPINVDILETGSRLWLLKTNMWKQNWLPHVNQLHIYIISYLLNSTGLNVSLSFSWLMSLSCMLLGVWNIHSTNIWRGGTAAYPPFRELIHCLEGLEGGAHPRKQIFH